MAPPLSPPGPQTPGRQVLVSLMSGAERYSTEVPQPTRTWLDSGTRSRTVTCGDTLLWTACPLMACKRSGVRIPLAPQVRSEIRTVRTAHTAAKYSNAAGTIYAPASPEQALLPRLGCWHGRLNPEPGTVLGAVTRKKRPIRPSIDTCPAAGTWRPFRVTLAAWATRQASHARRAVVVSARMPADRLRHGAAWCAG